MIKRQLFFSHGNAFSDNSYLPQEIFAIDTWEDVIYALWNMVASTCLYWLIVERLITIKNKSLTEITSDLQPERFFVINSHKPSCRELKHAWIARFHDPVTM